MPGRVDGTGALIWNGRWVGVDAAHASEAARPTHAMFESSDMTFAVQGKQLPSAAQGGTVDLASSTGTTASAGAGLSG